MEIGENNDSASILGFVGRTPLVELKRVIPTGHARVFVKLESQNTTGSVKDRMALSVVDRAVESGRLRPSGTVVEYMGGSTGISLAFVCAARGYAVTVVTSDAFSREKRDHMRASGANVVAALQVAKCLGSGKTVVTLLCDSGLKYLSTDLYVAGPAS